VLSLISKDRGESFSQAVDVVVELVGDGDACLSSGVCVCVCV